MKFRSGQRNMPGRRGMGAWLRYSEDLNVCFREAKREAKGGKRREYVQCRGGGKWWVGDGKASSFPRRTRRFAQPLRRRSRWGEKKKLGKSRDLQGNGRTDGRGTRTSSGGSIALYYPNSYTHLPAMLVSGQGATHKVLCRPRRDPTGHSANTIPVRRIAIHV